MKSFIRSLMPEVLRQYHQKAVRHGEERKNLGKTTEEVFTEIYRKNSWGGSAGEFCSGAGTIDEPAVDAYVAVLSELAAAEDFEGLTFVDLGCGDFRVGSRLLPLCSRYIGVDVVGPLIQMNNRRFGGPTTRFRHLDIVKDPLPDGDVCFVRQVLQHLSNRQIASVLGKLRKYGWVFVTEHYPTDNPAVRPNKDKPHGPYIRVYDNSGVYLTEPPFCLPPRTLRQVLEVPGSGLGDGCDQGVIRTFLYQPGK